MREIVIITGASSGIGRALTLLLVARGKEVLAIARNLKELQKLQKHQPNLINIMSADIATVEGRDSVLSFVSRKVKVLALVNNAALMTPSGYLRDIDLKKWRYQMAVNVEAPLFLTNSLLPFLHNGRVLNLSIYSSFDVAVGLGSYAISKAALNMMTKYMRVEFKKDNVAVGIALPGLVDTNIQSQLPASKAINLKSKIHNMKKNNRLLSPDIAAKFLTWLLLDANADQFSEKIWDVYDGNHHKYWATDLDNFRLV